jgi:hypothetical protein
MVRINFATGNISDDKNGLFSAPPPVKTPTSTTRKRKPTNPKNRTGRNKTGRKNQNVGGGYIGDSLKKIMEKIKSIRFKHPSTDKIEYFVTRNADNTADIYTIKKNGIVIKEKEVVDNRINKYFKKIIDRIRHIFKRNDKNDAGDKIGGSPMSSVDNITIDENTNLYYYIYELRNVFDVFGRGFVHLILLLTFHLFYIIFFVLYAAVNKEIPLGFYHKYIIINGRKIPT